MKKTVLFLLNILVLSWILSLPAFAASREMPYIQDDAGILSAQEEENLTALAREASRQLNCGIYILTTEDYLQLPHAESLQIIDDIIADYYCRTGYGFGPNQDGTILVLSMAERDYCFYTHGSADTDLSDGAMDHITSSFFSDISNNMWYYGFEDYIETTEKELKRSRDGHPFVGTYYHPAARILGILGCFAIGFLVAHRTRKRHLKELQTVAVQTHAENFLSPMGLEITLSEDLFTHSTTNRMRICQAESSSHGSGRRSRSHSQGYVSGRQTGSSRSGKF